MKYTRTINVKGKDGKKKRKKVSVNADNILHANYLFEVAKMKVKSS